MNTQNLIGLLLGENLNKSFRILVRLGPRVGNEGELSNLVLHAILFQILLSLSHPSDLRVGVHNRWNGVVVDVPMAGLDVLDSSNALFFGLVGKHGPKCDVADTLDSGDRSVELVVDHDPASVVNLESDVLKAETLGVRPAADRDEDDVGLQSILLATFGSLDFDVYLAICLAGAGDLGVELELDTLLREGFLECLAVKSVSIILENEEHLHSRNFIVDSGTANVAQELDDSHLGTQPTPNTSHL